MDLQELLKFLLSSFAEYLPFLVIYLAAAMVCGGIGAALAGRAGALAGSVIGAFAIAMMTHMGNLYIDLLAEGMDHDDAGVVAVRYGAIRGAVSMIVPATMSWLLLERLRKRRSARHDSPGRQRIHQSEDELVTRRLIKEFDYLLAWFVFWIFSTIAGAVAGAVGGGALGIVLALQGVADEGIVIGGAIVGFIMGVLASYLVFRIVVAKMIVRKIVSHAPPVTGQFQPDEDRFTN